MIKKIFLVATLILATVITIKTNTKAGGSMIQNINENVAVITPNSKKIEKVVVTNIENTNIYNVFKKNGEVEVLVADITKEKAPKEVQKLINELKEGGVEKPVNARMFLFFVKWW